MYVPSFMTLTLFQLSNFGSVVNATKSDLQEMYTQRDHLNSIKITSESTLLDLRARFPDIARSNEDEINQNLYLYNKTEFREYAHWAKEDHEESMCQTDGSPESKGGRFEFRVTIPLPVGEDAPCAQTTGGGGGH